MARTWNNDDLTGEWGPAARAQLRAIEADVASVLGGAVTRTWTNDERTSEWGEAARAQLRALEVDVAAALSGGSGNPAPSSVPLFSYGGGVTNTMSGVHGPSDGANRYMGAWGRWSNTLGEYVQWDVWLDKGTYRVDHLDYLSTVFGVGAYDFGPKGGTLTQQFTLDQSDTADHGALVIKSVGDLTASSSGMYSIRYRCAKQAGAHTSGTDDYVAVFAIFLRGGRVGVVPFPNPDIPFSANPGSTQFSHTLNDMPLLRTSAVIPQSVDTGNGPTADTALTPKVDGTPGNVQTVVRHEMTPLDSITHASGFFMESECWLDAGTYNFDAQCLLGTNYGVGQLKIDGTAVGTPQAAGTVRLIGAQTSPGNGNNGGSALTTGEIDFYDALGASLTSEASSATFDGGSFVSGVINDALTGITVASSGWKTVRLTCTGKNSSSISTGYDIGMRGFFRRTA